MRRRVHRRRDRVPVSACPLLRPGDRAVADARPDRGADAGAVWVRRGNPLNRVDPSALDWWIRGQHPAGCGRSRSALRTSSSPNDHAALDTQVGRQGLVFGSGCRTAAISHRAWAERTRPGFREVPQADLSSRTEQTPPLRQCRDQPERHANVCEVADVAEPVKAFETSRQDFVCASFSMVGLLIHAAVGSFGGLGRRLPNRHGLAA